MTTIARDMAEAILTECADGEVSIEEGLFSLRKLAEYAESLNDTAAHEIFMHQYEVLIDSSEEVDDVEEPADASG